MGLRFPASYPLQRVVVDLFISHTQSINIINSREDCKQLITHLSIKSINILNSKFIFKVYNNSLKS